MFLWHLEKCTVCNTNLKLSMTLFLIVIYLYMNCQMTNVVTYDRGSDLEESLNLL